MKLKKKYSLAEISSKYNCKILGDDQTTFEYVSSIFNSKTSNTLTDDEIFIFKKYVSRLKQTMEKK